jgi:Rhodopirellula transposase DDE domain
VSSKDSDEMTKQRVRHLSVGREMLLEHEPGLLEALDRLVNPETRGDPMSPLRWTSKSTARLALELQKAGYKISANTVAGLRKQTGYRLQSARKKLVGLKHEVRILHFPFINNSVTEFQKKGDPVVSIDAKKKALIGAFHNKGKATIRPTRRSQYPRFH